MSVLSRIPRKASYGLTLLMLTNLVVAVGGQEAAAAEPLLEPPDLQTDEPVAVTPVEPSGHGFVDPSADQVWDGQDVATALPQPGSRVFTLGSVGSASQVEYDDFPVVVAAPTQRQEVVPQPRLSGPVTVEIVDQARTKAVGVQGLLLSTTTSGAGAADIAVDYSGFADLFGGDWSSRLQLVELPACALTTPTAAECLQLTPLGSHNSTSGQTVSVRVQFDVPGLDREGAPVMRLLALTALSSSGDGGDYRATDLSPTGSWTAGGSDGAFTYSYPLRVPPAAGPVPSVSLGYSSASHDGRTSGRNSQASWLGDGWGYEPGFIERSYKPCSADEDGSNNPQVTGDLCWDGDNPHVTVSLNGTNSSLVLDDSSGQWRAAADGNWRIQQLGSPASSSSATSERWVVTTPDGTSYYFAGEPATSNSRLTVPVFGNHPGEPCRASAFADSSCDQAYRWLLDKVVDVHGNMVRYFYTTDTGHYGAAADANNRVSYDRAARLLRIEYGLRADDSSVPATGRVLFTSEHRCLENCGSLANPTVENWPDTPWDLHCDQAPCTGNLSPTFFSTARLAKVATQVRNGGAWRQVDSWSLEHEFKDYGEDEQVVLWLKSIQHTGHVGTDITLPKVQFAGEALPNRVDAAAGVPVMWRWRMSSIKTETGAVITVTYADPQCSPSNLPSQAHSNTMRCYPVRWTPEFHTQPLQDWFHKHVVASVVETDTTGGSVAVETYYEYSTAGGGTSMLWAFDDGEFTEDEHRTYGMWRGYPQVTTRVGDPAEQQTVTRTRFYRGMHNQPLPSGGTRSVQLTDAEGNTVTDHEALAGRMWETLTYDDTTIIAGSTYKYWTRNTATRERDHDGGDLKAWMIGLSTEQSRTRLTGSDWQRTETRTSYDNQGRIIRVNDLGDVADSSDDLCTRMDYVESSAAWIKDKVSRVETVAVDCDDNPTRPDDVISDVLTFYDGSETHGTAPVKGMPTRIDTLDSWDNGPVYVTTSRMDYDPLGRAVENIDALGNSTTTSYTPAGGGPVTEQTVTNPLGHEVTNELEPAWGLPTATTEPNGRRVDLQYDALGRSIAVWLPGRVKGSHTPSMQFEYLIRDNAPSAVTTKTLNHLQNYVTEIVLYDSLLRQRQTQTETADHSRTLIETIYDTQGRVDETSGPNYNLDPPSTTLVHVGEADSERRNTYVYDGASRVVEEIFYDKHTERWRTTTTYGGNANGFMVTVQPPDGAPAIATITNARGQEIERRTYHGNTPIGTYDTLTYDYTPDGQIAAMTDMVGNQWSWQYDLRGRQTLAADPDAGTSTKTYDIAGQLTSTTDARGQTLTYEYDPLGRMTARKDGNDTPLAEWEYDTAIGGIGMLAKSTRWIDGQAYINQIRAINGLGMVSQASVTLPASEGPLAGTYWFTRIYYPNGQLARETYDDAGDVEGGSLRHYYNHLDNPTRLIFYGDYTGGSGPTVIIDQAAYTPFNEIQTRLFGANNGKQAWHGFEYEPGTRRLTRATFDRQASVQAVADVRYSYDDAGNVLSIEDVPDGLPANHELQCFQYDHHRRLTEAWAQGDTSECAAVPSVNMLGGPAPYWHSYTHDATGNRTSETLRTPGAAAVSRNYTYPAAGDPQPHALQQVTSTGASGAMSFTYDQAGNTTSRTVDGQLQELTWDAEGRITQVQDGGDSIRMVYDADGNRLIRDDGDTVTAYLPQTELTWDRATNTVDGTRYFTHAGQVVAVCTGQDPADWTWMGVDHHGTTTTHSVNALTAVEQARRTDPYGNPRGTAPQTWPGQQGFVGGVHDPTDLIHIGARSYDPSIGRFLSVDPILDIGDGQQINGYAYAHSNPVTFTDPTGLFASVNGVPCIDGDCSYHNRDGSLKTAAQCKAQQCGSGYGSSTASSQPGTSPLIPAEAWSDPCITAPTSDYCKVLTYIVDEMTNNSTSPEVLAIQHLLSEPTCTLSLFGICIHYTSPDPVAAMSMWTGLVCQKFCKWDHKGPIRDMFEMDLEDLDSLMFDIPGTDLRINYDIWSNVHYGYVGSVAGFDRGTLNIVDHLPSNPITGRQDQGDSLYANLGIDLYLTYSADPTKLTTGALHIAIMSLVNEHGGPGGVLREERRVLPVK